MKNRQTFISMKYAPLFALVLLTALLHTSCEEQVAAVANQPDPFFDLEAYIEAQISSLNQKQPKVRKTILVEGQRETQQFDSLDYRTELKTFLNSDINRKAWVDKYKADSTFEGSQLKQVTYTATGADLKTRLLRVKYDQGEVSDIYIENRTNSIVADVRQDLHFQPGQGYRLVTTQETVLSEEQEIEVEVKWQ
ncbi:hypothetical protein [Phaeodactylibacter sp.]|uniref:hypothetical protein n=1 Tax=Phaeodactylibacter sp. TaxID=1940289 RepID=UPI0025EDEB2A|nr:hypothetical protein [Phaeodactylibacter sp.]MCI4651473.1 hypothetical protein [Phaeodactylibacter sp.]MCI5093181.1 hypothetical protein [Phaeodactylibacter sp.]